MRVVIDTNVLVSALYKRGSPPDHAVFAAIIGHVRPLLDQRIIAEYTAVLSRPRFAFDATLVTTLIDGLKRTGEWVDTTGVTLPPLPDEDDRPFCEVAVAGRADAIVTGNARHYPSALGVLVLGPAELIDRLRASASTTSVAQLFMLLGAPSEWVAWAGAFGSDLGRAYRECQHGEVVGWMAEKLGAPPEELARARIRVILAAAVAKLPEHPASQRAIESVERFEAGEIDATDMLAAIRRASRVNHPDGVRPGVGGLWSLTATDGLIPIAASEEEARANMAHYADTVRAFIPFESLPLPKRWAQRR